jgi:hypothetical protein
MAIYPADELVVVVLTNTDSPVSSELGEAIARSALAVPEAVIEDRPISAAEAAPFEGTYDFPELGIKLQVKYEDGKLRVANLDDKGQPTGWLALRYQGGRVFAAPEVKARLAFIVDGERATGLEVDQAAATSEARACPDRAHDPQHRG